jgi:hypothetical protein
MSTNRRSLLQGLAALPVAAVPAVAPALAAPASDPAITELARLYEETWARLMTAMDAFNAAEGRLARPAMPEALYAREDERAADMSGMVRREPSGRRYYVKTAVEAMRGWKVEWSAPLYLPTWERRDEIVGVWDAWQAAQKAAEDAAGYTEANEAYGAALNADDAVRLRIINFRSTDPAVLRLKLRAMADSAGHLENLDGAIAFGIEQHGPSEDEFALSIARDLCAVHGVTS